MYTVDEMDSDIQLWLFKMNVHAKYDKNISKNVFYK